MDQTRLASFGSVLGSGMEQGRTAGRPHPTDLRPGGEDLRVTGSAEAPLDPSACRPSSRRAQWGRQTPGAMRASASAEDRSGRAFDGEGNSCRARRVVGFAERPGRGDGRPVGHGQVAPELDPLGDGDPAAIGEIRRPRALPARAGRARIVGRAVMGRRSRLPQLEDREAVQRRRGALGRDPGMSAAGSRLGRGKRSGDREHEPGPYPATGPAITTTRKHGNHHLDDTGRFRTSDIGRWGRTRSNSEQDREIDPSNLAQAGWIRKRSRDRSTTACQNRAAQ